MKKIILYTLVLAGIFTSCAKAEFIEKISTVKTGHEFSFIANTDNSSATKTALDGLDILWVAADPVMIFGTDADSNPKVSGYAAHAAGGSAGLDWTTNISGTEGAFVAGETPQYALYPTDATNASISGSVITFKLPETQTYAANSFGQGANVAVGKVKTGEGIADIKFKNVCGYLKLQVSVPASDAATVGKIILTTKGTEKLWGTFTADASSDSPVAAYKSGATDGSTSVTLNCPDGVAVSTDASNPTVFYIVVPVGSLASGFTAEVYSKQGHLMTTMETTKDISIVRNRANKMAVETFNWIPADYAEQAYIQSTGYQTIDTGYGNAPGFRFVFDFEIIDKTTGCSNPAFCGVAGKNPSYCFTALDMCSSEGYIVRYMFNSAGANRPTLDNNKHNIDVSFIKNSCHYFLDGVNKSVPNHTTDLQLTFSAGFTGCHKRDYDDYSKFTYLPSCTAKWYYCDMYDCTNTQIRQFIPAYKSTGESGHQYGMYDVLNDVFYTNAFTETGACDYNGGTI